MAFAPPCHRHSHALGTGMYISVPLDPTFGLDAQAIDAVKQWRFRPGRNRGQQVVPCAYEWS